MASKNYSFHCKHCGHTFMSNDKADIRKAKKGHGRCPMVRLKNGHITRPELVNPDISSSDEADYRVHTANKGYRTK